MIKVQCFLNEDLHKSYSMTQDQYDRMSNAGAGEWDYVGKRNGMELWEKVSQDLKTTWVKGVENNRMRVLTVWTEDGDKLGFGFTFLN